jgi:ABC-type antimicrobial peptide transport system permease subunit
MHEFSVRLALGARSADLRRMIIGHGFGLAALGAVLGLAAALAAARFIRATLYGVEPTDPLTLTLVLALMLTVALVACLQPARRATRIDPAQMLRSD